MTFLLDPPNWDALVGGAVETAWTADRHRKIELATALSLNIERVYQALCNRDALFAATPDSLCCDPYAAHWYVSLAGFSQNTLNNTSEMPKKMGMTMSPGGVVKGLWKALEKDQLKPVLTKKIRDNILPFCD
jgi:hypothetical protein